MRVLSPEADSGAPLQMPRPGTSHMKACNTLPILACRWRRCLLRHLALWPSLGGLSVAVGYKARWGAWLLVGLLVPVTLMMHAFWRLQDPVAIHVQQAMFAKNMSMLGAALVLTQVGSRQFSLDGGK
jgi:uncharacterized membrane protein YphA (DoxX/SURF4 family)